MKTTVKLRTGETLTIEPSATRKSVQITVKTALGLSVGALVANEDWAVIAQAGTIVAEQNAAHLAAGLLAPAGAPLSASELAYADGRPL